MYLTFEFLDIFETMENLGNMEEFEKSTISEILQTNHMWQYAPFSRGQLIVGTICPCVTDVAAPVKRTDHTSALSSESYIQEHSSCPAQFMTQYPKLRKLMFGVLSDSQSPLSSICMKKLSKQKPSRVDISVSLTINSSLPLIKTMVELVSIRKKNVLFWDLFTSNQTKSSTDFQKEHFNMDVKKISYLLCVKLFISVIPLSILIWDLRKLFPIKPQRPLFGNRQCQRKTVTNRHQD